MMNLRNVGLLPIFNYPIQKMNYRGRISLARPVVVKEQKKGTAHNHCASHQADDESPSRVFYERGEENQCQ
jgi:hypothetical protein